MIGNIKKATYSKQATTLFALIFALMAILGLVSIMSPNSADEIVTPSQTIPVTNTYTGYLLRVVVVTLTMIVLLIIALKIYQKQMKLKGKNNLVLNIQGRHYINEKQYLLKVNIEGKYLLLGVSESSINFISELDAPVDDPDSDTNSFGTILDLETNKATKI